jgi:hypothetical protein
MVRFAGGCPRIRLPRRSQVHSGIPYEVRALLQRRVDSLEKLEALLLVRGDAAKRWTASTVAAKLGLPETWSEPALEALCTSALLLGQGEGSERQFSYRPPTAALEAAVTSLAEIYGDRRAQIIRILSSKAVSRIRRAAVRAFGSGWSPPGTRFAERGDSTGSSRARARAERP